MSSTLTKIWYSCTFILVLELQSCLNISLSVCVCVCGCCSFNCRSPQVTALRGSPSVTGLLKLAFPVGPAPLQWTLDCWGVVAAHSQARCYSASKLNKQLCLMFYGWFLCRCPFPNERTQHKPEREVPGSIPGRRAAVFCLNGPNENKMPHSYKTLL